MDLFILLEQTTAMYNFEPPLGLDILRLGFTQIQQRLLTLFTESS